MVIWQDVWLNNTDANGIKLENYVSQYDNDYAICNFCNKHLKYSQNGFQTIFAHSEKMKLKTMSNAKYNTNQAHIVVSSKPTSSKSTPQSSGSATPSSFQLDLQKSMYNTGHKSTTKSAS